MGIELGRVSGPLLSNNLIRHGIDLAFSNTDVSTPVLKLDVNNRRIGINNDSPTRDFLVGTNSKTTNLIVDTSSVFQNFTILTNSISHVSDTIYIRPDQTSDPRIVVPALKASNLLFDYNTITNTVLNNNIEISPTGQLVTNGSVLVNGTVHATGDITWDGDITLGNADTDNITFSADVNSNIVPNNETFEVGSTLKRWARTYTNEVTSGTIIADAFVTNSVNPALRPGNTKYVSINGSDTARGNHAHAPYRTLKAALTSAVAGDEIVIFPGTYTEIFPLVIPKGVSVKGTGIRSVTIQPTVGTQTNDAFLLDGETTVEFLTVTNFYYNSATDTGYGFRFNPSLDITSRSPYVFQTTVITQSSGLLAAGRGAIADGSYAQESSNQPAMLFHAVTLITKGADGLTIKNGARVEWLNCFTYFANRGIYLYSEQSTVIDGGDNVGTFIDLLDGGDAPTVNLEFSDGGSATSLFSNNAKVELRSINSANVYGSYGVVADGNQTLAYLVGHNFSYIGSGLDSTNDPSLTQQANEVVTIDQGVVYYDSVDHQGTLRVGDVFSVNQETGKVVISAQAVNFANGGSISLAGAGNTYIDSKIVQTGNIVIHDNNIDSLSGPVNFYAASGTTTWNTDTNVTGNVSVTGDFVVAGDITVGDQAFDTVSVIPRLTQTIKPNANALFALGSSSARWRNVYLNGTFDIDNDFSAGSWDLLTGYFEVPNIKIDGNTLSVTQTDTDLNLQANGTGGVIFDKLKVTNTTISAVDANQSIQLSPNGTGNTVINTNTALNLPIGNNSTRSLSALGEVRFNSSTTLFEGWQSSGLVSFKDLYDSDRNTYITAELTPGTNDNILRFGINGTVKATIDSTKLYTNTLYGGNVQISSNNISNVSSSTDTSIKTYKVGGDYTNIGLTRVIGAGATFAITIEDGVYKTGENVVTDPGTNYDVGTLISLPGFYLSGVTPDNNCYVRVVSVDAEGGITNAVVDSGVAVGTDGTYLDNVQNGISTGTSGTLDISWAVDATDYTLNLNDVGNGYRTGERYRVLGTQLGGTTPQNDLIIAISATAGQLTAVTQIIEGTPFSPSTADVILADTKIRDNTIQNVTSGALALDTLEDGYVKFESNGLVIPVGDNDQRRLTPEIGELRFNTDLQYAEIYNGDFWQPVKGSSPELGVEDLLEIMGEWTLILG